MSELQEAVERPMKPADIFGIHPKIRWAALATRDGQIVFRQMRLGVVSITPDSTDRVTFEVRAQYIVESVEQETKWAGPVDHLDIHFEKYVEVLVPLRAGYVAITVEKDLSPANYKSIAASIRALE
jgi:hypothetical protein